MLRLTENNSALNNAPICSGSRQGCAMLPVPSAKGDVYGTLNPPEGLSTSKPIANFKIRSRAEERLSSYEHPWPFQGLEFRSQHTCWGSHSTCKPQLQAKRPPLWALWVLTCTTHTHTIKVKTFQKSSDDIVKEKKNQGMENNS